MENITRLFDFAYYQLENYNLEKALITKYDGKWVATSSKEFLDKANTVSRALLRMGVKANDKIGVISMTNRTEWNIMDIGVLQVGAQNVPIYPTISEEDYAYILNHSEAKYVFVSCAEVYGKVKAIKDQVAILTSDALVDSRFDGGESIQLYGIRSAMCVPLFHQDKIFGIIHVDSLMSSNCFTTDGIGQDSPRF